LCLLFHKESKAICCCFFQTIRLLWNVQDFRNGLNLIVREVTGGTLRTTVALGLTSFVGWRWSSWCTPKVVIGSQLCLSLISAICSRTIRGSLLLLIAFNQECLWTTSKAL
jgi:hypothetical protein